MDDMVQNPEAQKLAQMLQQQQMQKFLQQLQGAGAGPMTNADMLRQSHPMFAQEIPQGEFNQRPVPMLGQPMPQGSMGSRPVPMPYSNSPSGVSAQEYEMMRKMPR